MNLIYSVLWFDDSAEYFESLDLDPIKEEIYNLGFTAEFKFVTDPSEFEALSPYKRYDLLVVDYNLGIEKHGDRFIREIRDHGIYTEVVFYSATFHSELWDSVRDHKLEGVFLAHRTALQEKIEKVAKQSVKKVLDLNNVRGIVMAEVGEIDSILDNLIIKGFAKLDEPSRDKKLQAYKNKVEGFYQNRQRKAEECTDIKQLLKLLDSANRWHLVKSLAKDVSDIDFYGLGDYQKDVLNPRNHLAHGVPKTEQDALVFSHGNGKEYRFTEEKSTSLLKLLDKYSKHFVKIRDNL